MSMIEQTQDSQRGLNTHAADLLRYATQPGYFASRVTQQRPSFKTRMLNRISEAKYRAVNAWWFLRYGYSRHGED